MNLFGVMEIAGSALGAERLRAEVVVSNMANLETTHTPGGGPYRRRLTVFRAENASPFLFQLASFSPSGTALTGTALGRVPGGVRIAKVVTDTSAPLRRYQPGHPDADAAGYVAYPAVNPAEEMTDLLGAVRAYELNASSVQAAKQMIQQSIAILG
jgi:flagellar basal-body rod protein FlgC